MKLAHIHPEFKEDFVAQRRYKKFALAVVVDSIGFDFAGQELQKYLLDNYHSLIFKHINPESKNLKKRYRVVKKRLNERILEIQDTYFDDIRFLNDKDHYILNLLDLTPEDIKRLKDQRLFDSYKLTLDLDKDLSKVQHPYLELLERIDDVQFL